jgi:hypothetical protein
MACIATALAVHLLHSTINRPISKKESVPVLQMLAEHDTYVTVKGCHTKMISEYYLIRGGGCRSGTVYVTFNSIFIDDVLLHIIQTHTFSVHFVSH